jgi:hypothetical protein
MDKKEIDFYEVNKHRVLEFDDHLEISCPKTEEDYKTYTRFGKIACNCPGCGIVISDKGD